MNEEDLKKIVRHGTGEFERAIALVRLAEKKDRLSEIEKLIDELESGEKR